MPHCVKGVDFWFCWSYFTFFDYFHSQESETIFQPLWDPLCRLHLWGRILINQAKHYYKKWPFLSFYFGDWIFPILFIVYSNWLYCKVRLSIDIDIKIKCQACRLRAPPNCLKRMSKNFETSCWIWVKTCIIVEA